MRNAGIQIRVCALLFALQKRWKIILSLTFIGLIFGLMLSGMTYIQSSLQTYQIKGSLAVNTRRPNGNYLGNYEVPSHNDFNLSIDLVEPVVYVMRSDRTMYQLIESMDTIGIIPADIKNALTITQYNTTQILTMTLTWPTAEEGLAIWNGIVRETNALLPETLQVGNLSIINEPETELLGVGGSSGTTGVFLALLGFAAGVGYAVMELLMHPTLNNVKDVETMFGLENIGIIPHDPQFFKAKNGSLLMRDDAGSSPISQSYATTAYILRNRLGTKEAHHCLYVTSAINREGRTSVAANIALHLSDMEQHTLLIDFDTHNPSLGALFLSNVDYNRSLNAFYRGEINEGEAITTLTGYLDILPMVLEHNAISMDSTIEEMFKGLIEKYDYVIIDAPPVGRESEALSLNQVASSALFVVGYDNATIPDIQSALDKLDKTGIRVVGCVANDVHAVTRFALDNKEDERAKIREKKGRLRKKKRDKEKPFFEKDESDAHEADELIESGRQPEAPKKEKKRRWKKDQRAAREQKPEENTPLRAGGVIRPVSHNLFEDLYEGGKPAKTDPSLLNELTQAPAREEKKDGQ